MQRLKERIAREKDNDIKRELRMEKSTTVIEDSMN
jgi:hypothetical protein